VKGITPSRCAVLLAVLCGLASAPASALAHDPPDPGSTQSFTYGSGMTSNPYIVYTPRSYNRRHRAPLFVMVHGCQTTAYQQMRANLINQLAERKGFLVLYPDIDALGRQQPGPTQNCWRFPAPTSWQRGQGDAAAIAGMTQAVIRRWNIDPQRVYLSGMSAGGFMTSILAAAYPDVYAAVAIAAGGAYGDGSCLFGAPGVLSADQSAQLARAQEGPRARVVPILVMGGDADAAVSPPCADKALEQGLRTDNLILDGIQTAPIKLSPESVRVYQKPGGYSYRISSYLDGHGCLIGQRVLIHGMNHFWPGGSADPQWHDWTDPKGPSGAVLAWSFVSRFRRNSTAWSCRRPRPRPTHKRPRRGRNRQERRGHQG
jgi:poly(hydroxyalkanoate) depolymerase family esterase